MIVFTPMNIYYNYIEKYKESQKLIINVEQIDHSIENVILLRKLKCINYKQCCSKLKALYNKRKRQIRRQINFFNNYTLKYDYYYPLIDMNNYIDIFYKCRKSTAWKRTYQNFNINIIKNVSYIWYNMMNNTINTLPHKHFKVNERGKIRDISAPEINERLVQSNLSSNIAHPLMDKTLIFDNYASQLNKGTTIARKRYKQFLIENYKYNKDDSYVLKIDIKKFFDSIDHNISMDKWNKYIKNEYVLNIIKQILDKKLKSNGVGLCLGSELSQLTASLYLSKMDHILKEYYRIKWYGRYNDDICIIHKSKEFLTNLLKQIKIGLSTIGLKINDIKTKIIYLKNNSFTILKTKYFYDKYKNCGKVIMLSGKKSSKIERRKLRKFKTKMMNNTMAFLEIFNLYKAWRKNILKSFNAYNLISRNDEYFKHLFNLKYANFKNKIYIFK